MLSTVVPSTSAPKSVRSLVAMVSVKGARVVSLRKRLNIHYVVADCVSLSLYFGYDR
jgi:hypothetical protein